tara:strand:- start:138 stop:353 length:216 start_codon:yes stop_codon:yes gene_type:complete
MLGERAVILFPSRVVQEIPPPLRVPVLAAVRYRGVVLQRIFLLRTGAISLEAAVLITVNTTWRGPRVGMAV